jgi:hypothetical protein
MQQDAVSISRNPSSRGQSLTDSLCAPSTPASSNMHRGMSIASERSLATLEEEPQEVPEGPLRRGHPNYMTHNTTPSRTTTSGSHTSGRPPWYRNISEHSVEHNYPHERSETPASTHTPSERSVASSRCSDGVPEDSANPAGAAYGARSSWDAHGGANPGHDRRYEEYMEQQINAHQHRQQMTPSPSASEARKPRQPLPVPDRASPQQQQAGMSPSPVQEVSQHRQQIHPSPFANQTSQQHQVSPSPFSSYQTPQQREQSSPMRFANGGGHRFPSDGGQHQEHVSASPFSAAVAQGVHQVGQSPFANDGAQHQEHVRVSPFANGPSNDPRSPKSASHVTTPPTPPLVATTPPPSSVGVPSGSGARAGMSPAYPASVSHDHELSPFEAQSMMPFDDGSTPTSQSSQRQSMYGRSCASSPHVKSVLSAECQSRDSVGSRGSSMGSRHGLLTMELRQTMGSRSGSRGSSGGGSMGQASHNGNGNGTGTLADSGNPVLRAAIRQRAEAHRRAEGHQTPGGGGGGDWQAASKNAASPRPPVPSHQAAAQSPAPQRLAQGQLTPNSVRDSPVRPEPQTIPWKSFCWALSVSPLVHRDVNATRM